MEQVGSLSVKGMGRIGQEKGFITLFLLPNAANAKTTSREKDEKERWN